MPELFAQSAPSSILPMLMVDNLTTAPGDLPISEIIARIAAQRQQFRHDNIVIPSTLTIGQDAEIWSTSGEDMPLASATLFYTTDGSFPTTLAQAISCERMHISWDIRTGYVTHWRALIPAQSAQAVVRYRIGGWKTGSEQCVTEIPNVWAQDGQGYWFHFSGEQAVTTFAYSVEESPSALPAWVQNGVIYQIFLDRFRTNAPGGAFPIGANLQELHGGTLRGVCDALPYLADLGVTCLWLSPVSPAETYHRYDATDFYNVDPHLGTNDDLKMLTDQAHTLGMRVLLDFVPSHLSWHHPAFVGAQQDHNAPSAAWFTFYEWPDRYKSFLEIVPSLPSLNTENEQARAHVIDSAVQWIRDYGIDGFRLDHAIGQSMDFWVAFRRAIREVAPDVVSIGEATDTPDCLKRYRGKLDYILDFPLASAFRHTFALLDWDVQKFDHFLFTYEQFMASGPGRVSFLDNHDMDRFLFMADNDAQRLKLAALCQFTLNGPPVIYYGTEIGMSQYAASSDPESGGDAQARLDMTWDQDHWNHDLLNFYRALIDMRKKLSVLHQGYRRTVHLNPAQHTYAYVRTVEPYQGELISGALVVLFNLSDQQQTLPLPVSNTPGKYHLLLDTRKNTILQETTYEFEVQLMPTSGIVLQYSLH